MEKKELEKKAWSVLQSTMQILKLTEIDKTTIAAFRFAAQSSCCGVFLTPEGEKAVERVVRAAKAGKFPKDEPTKDEPTKDAPATPAKDTPAKDTPATPTESNTPTGVVRHEKYAECKELIEFNMIPYIYGPAGTGKTFFAMQLAEDLGLPFFMTGAVDMVHELVGFVDANGHYNDTPFYHAITEGGLFLFDEVDGSCAGALTAINSVLANGVLTIPKFGTIKVHPNFRMIAAGNTKGDGPNDMYVSRNVLDAATRDRFVLEEFDYCIAIEKKITEGDNNLIDFVHELRNVIKQCDAKYVVSYRGMNNFMNFKKMKAFEGRIWYALKKAFFEQMNDDDMSVIVGNLGIKNNPYVKLAKTNVR